MVESVLGRFSEELAGLLDQAGPSVVQVNARRRLPASGIVWDAEGTIVTADHVVERDEDISVGLADGRIVSARLVGRDPGTDLAALKIEAGRAQPARLAPDGSVKIGHLALAVGRPELGAPSATIGFVNAVGGAWRTGRGGFLSGYVRAEVTMLPGFSGGPLVNAAGEIVGMNTSQLDVIRWEGRTPNFEPPAGRRRFGFPHPFHRPGHRAGPGEPHHGREVEEFEVEIARLPGGGGVTIPVAALRPMVEALLSHGMVRRAYLGLSSQPVEIPETLAAKLKLEQRWGLMTLRVEPSSPADQGGLLVGDIVISFAGRRIAVPEDLQASLTAATIGQPTVVQIVRAGGLAEITVTPGERG